MANTLKFGAGQWAVKEGSALAYNSENGNFKPLPFTFDRSTSATRVNKEGLIEVVSNNEPRIDFLNDSKGALLLEPQRSNLALYSNDLSNAAWTKTLSTITSNAAISPDGTLNANKIVETTDNNLHRAGQGSISVTSGQIYTFSFYAKAGERNELELQRINTSGTVFNSISVTNVDLTLGTLSVGSNVTSSSITSVGNGWHRITISLTAIATGSGGLNIGMQKDGNVLYLGDGTSGVYIWGFQVEQGSYATSYIPTQGSAVTRVNDSCSQTAPDGVIGQTEGTIFVDLVLNNPVNSINRVISVTGANWAGNGSMRFDFTNQNKIISDVTFQGANSVAIEYSIPLNQGDRYKVAFVYKENDCKMYVNGVFAGAQTSTGGIPACSQIHLNELGAGFGGPFEASSHNQVKLYNTRLSNSELIALTQV